jgi:hypothetical protein
VLETRLLLGVAALAAAASAAGACVWYGYNWGADSVHAKWGKAQEEAGLAAAAEKESVRESSYALARELQTQLDTAEKRYAQLSSRYTKSLGSKFECPASGVIGDVVLPADLTDSLFITDKQAANKAGPAASGASAALR